MIASEVTDYIHSYFRKGAPLGLDRIRKLMDSLGNPQNHLKFIHIAGTNGKGSTAAMTASILQKAGYKTGLFTSPFIYRFNERMQINGEEISDEDLVAATETVRPFAEGMAEKPTEFELVCAIAFCYFSLKKCDIVVLEVGMGGIVDPTNIIPVPEVAVITNIGLDHTEILGDTTEKIAANKAGILKPGGHAVVYRSTPSVEAIYEQICKEKQISLKKADFDSLVLHRHDLDGQLFDCGKRKNLRLPLLGNHQLHNAAVVLSVMDTLQELGWQITEQNIKDGLLATYWPGRFDIAARDPLFIIDGGHNPQCFDALVDNIREYLSGRTVIALTGVLADKDYGKMYQPMIPYVSKFVCITPPSPRKLEAEELAAHLRQTGAEAIACQSVAEGVQAAKELAGKNGAVVCFGSLYSISIIRDALKNLK